MMTRKEVQLATPELLDWIDALHAGPIEQIVPLPETIRAAAEDELAWFL